jgi:hypothetical protein
VFEERFVYPSGARSTVRLLRLPAAEVLVHVEWWPQSPEPWAEAVPQRVLDSVRTGN